eukprot:g11833.t1
MHTRSTSSFSSWSVGSLNAPREGSTKVPDIRTIVDLATGRAGRVTAAKVGPSPSGSVGNGAGFNSSRTSNTYPCSPPPGPHATPARSLRGSLDNPVSQHYHSNPSPSNSADASRIPISPLVSMATIEQAAGLATKGGATAAPAPAPAEADAAAAAAASAAHAKAADGAKTNRPTNPTPPRCPAVAAPRRRINDLLQPRFAIASSAAASSRARRPPFNPYRVTARKASPRNAANARRQRGHHRRRSKNVGAAGAAAHRGRGRSHREQLGGCSTLASSPSSSSSSSSSSLSSDSCGKTYTVEWIWPAKGAGNWSPRVTARRRRATGGGPVAITAAAREGPPPAASRAPSSPSTAPSASKRRMGLGVQAWGGSNSAAGGRSAAGRGWTNPRHCSEARDDRCSRPQAQRGATRSLSARTAEEAPGGGVARRDGAVPARETFHPDGRGGWVRPPPRPLDTKGSTSRAPHSASAFPSAGTGPSGEKNNGDVEEDICDLAPLLMARTRVPVTGTTAARRAPSSGDNKASRPAAPAPAARLWKALRRIFDGRGRASPPPPPSSPPAMTQEENDSSFLNPFSPNSSRRFSTCSADGGAADDGYVSGYSGYESGDGSARGGFGGCRAAAAASRLSSKVFHPISDFNFEERVIGCIFGEEDGIASDSEVPRHGELGREDRGVQNEGREKELHGGGENETDLTPSHSRPSPRSPLARDNAWPLPAAADDGSTADDIDGCSSGSEYGSDDGSTSNPATSTAQSTIEEMLVLTKVAVEAVDPESTRLSPTCSTTSSRSPVAVTSANAATSAAASAATAAAIAGQASLAARVAAVTAKQARDAFVSGVDLVTVEARRSEDGRSLVGGAE